MRATRAIIHLENLHFNVIEIQKRLPAGTGICVAVKADAYGHGAAKVAASVVDAGATYLAVATVQEGVELREAGITVPILVLSLPIPDEFPILIEHELTPLVADGDFAVVLGQAARAMNRIVSVHLKVDTGMGRIGCMPERAADLARRIAAEKYLVQKGTVTHLAVADCITPDDIAFTHTQLARFTSAVAAIRNAGLDPGIVHAANSGAIIQYPEAAFDMARPGIIVYGYPPSPELADKMPLKPVMELITQIVSIKKVSAGTPVSYGRTWIAPHDTCIATIPVGYGDGLLRRLSPGLKVSINGESYPVIGRICMDQCMVDIGLKSTAERWDEVTVFGPAPATSSAETLAEILDTIPYEITCGINKRVPRIYAGE